LKKLAAVLRGASVTNMNVQIDISGADAQGAGSSSWTPVKGNSAAAGSPGTRTDVDVVLRSARTVGGLVSILLRAL